MKKYFAAALAAAAILACAAGSGATRRARQSEVSEEEYAVYSAVLDGMFAGGKVAFDSQAEVKRLVIDDHTAQDRDRGDAAGESWAYVRQAMPSLTPEAIADYTAKNKESSPLKRSLRPKLDYVLVERAELDKMFAKGGGWWEEFYRRFPDSGGYASLSRVGFDAGGNRALVYIKHSCGGLCGSGHYVLLKKEEGAWKVEKSRMVWIS